MIRFLLRLKPKIILDSEMSLVVLLFLSQFPVCVDNFLSRWVPGVVSCDAVKRS